MRSGGQSSGIEFLKGHGTQNDFVLLPDATASLDLTPDLVRALCDRQRGIGADGVLRVARADALCATGVLDELPAGVRTSDWFMDYRNSDGSVAEMCGNGVRVFAHHLAASGAVSESSFVVGSRAGGRRVEVHSVDESAADVSVEMGPVTLGADSKVVLGQTTFAGTAVDVGNPHLACIVAGMDVVGLGAVDLAHGADFDPALFPSGVNIEIVTPIADGAVDMRVLERGVGETRSCGTGTVAAAAAALRVATGTPIGTVDVRIPGGQVTVRIDDTGAVLRGPSILVAAGTLRAGWNTP